MGIMIHQPLLKHKYIFSKIDLVTRYAVLLYIFYLSRFFYQTFFFFFDVSQFAFPGEPP